MTENHDVNMKRMNRDIQKIQSEMERVTDIVYGMFPTIYEDNFRQKF